MSDARELLADQAHIMWAHWMQYQFSKCINVRSDGSLLIPPDLVARWRRLAETDYADLTEQERASDRDQADRMSRAITRAGLAIVPVEPTEAMIGEGIRLQGARAVWTAMLRAAQETGT